MNYIFLTMTILSLTGCVSLPQLISHSERNVVRVGLLKRDAIGNVMPKRYIGGGVVVNPKGAVLTCAHVVDTNRNMGVQFFDKEFRLYKVVAIDQNNDLALMMPHEYIPWMPYTLLALHIRKGESVYHIGHPLRMEWLASAGIISLIEKEVIVTDTVGNPGSSGGGLFNQYGQLIGLVHASRAILIPTYQGHMEVTRPDVLWKFMRDNESLMYQ